MSNSDEQNNNIKNVIKIKESDIEQLLNIIPNSENLSLIYKYHIRDQKNRNTCIINATLSLIEYLRQLEGYEYTILSSSFLYHFSVKEEINRYNGYNQNSGIHTISVLKSLLKNGVCDQKRWESVFDFNIKPSTKAIVNALSRLKDCNIEIIPNSLNVIRYVIGVTKRPIVAVIPSDIFDGNINTENHSVLFVGYDSEYIYYQNSYGESWGNKGFGKFEVTLVDQIINMYTMDQTCLKSLDYIFRPIKTRKIIK